MLYNSHRPTSFTAVLGQPAAQYLKNAIALGNLPHSLLISGTRGVGKTTLARIASKALNCELAGVKGADIPCGKCASCMSNDHPDIYEIDSTVHGNPQALLALQQRMSLVPTYKKKVFILDEAHTITQKGMAILLKSVEEPSAKSHIFLLTTEPDKIDQALRSRCTWLRLQNLTKLDIMKLLARVSVKEGIHINKAAVAKIAEHAQGSARDALSMLELLRSYDKITENVVDTTVGHKVDCSGFIAALERTDSYGAFVQIADLCLYHEPQVVLSAINASLMTKLKDAVMSGNSPKRYLEWITGPFKQAKADMYRSYNGQTVIEIAIAEIMYKSQITPKTLETLDWDDFCEYAAEQGDSELGDIAKTLKFVRTKNNKTVVCRQTDQYKKPQGLIELTQLIQSYFKNPKLILEIL